MKYRIEIAYNSKLHLSLLSNGVWCKGTEHTLVFTFDTLTSLQQQVFVHYLLND